MIPYMWMRYLLVIKIGMVFVFVFRKFEYAELIKLGIIGWWLFLGFVYVGMGFVKSGRKFKLWLQKISINTWINFVLWIYSSHSVQLLWDIALHSQKKYPMDDSNCADFSCSLDDLNEEILEEVDKENNSLDGYIVNKSFVLYDGEQYLNYTKFQPTPNHVLSCNPSYKTPLRQPAIYLIDPGTEMIFGYTVGKYYKWLKQCVADSQPPKDLPSNVIKLLKYIKVLVPLNYWESRTLEMNSRIKEYQKQINNTGFVVLKDIFPKIQFYALQKYILGLIDSNSKNTPTGYFYIWDNIVACMYNKKLVSVVQKITGEELYSVSPITLCYTEGSWLDFHFDYYPFLYSCSIMINKDSCPFTVICKGNTPKCVDVLLDEGEAVLFRGEECPHYRRKVQKGATPTISVSFSFDNIERYKKF